MIVNPFIVSRARKLDWDQIKFKDYCAEDCKKYWEHIQARIRRYVCHNPHPQTGSLIILPDPLSLIILPDILSLILGSIRFRILAEMIPDARSWLSQPWTNFYKSKVIHKSS